jgi:hypothetical protein
MDILFKNQIIDNSINLEVAAQLFNELHQYTFVKELLLQTPLQGSE